MFLVYVFSYFLNSVMPKTRTRMLETVTVKASNSIVGLDGDAPMRNRDINASVT